MSLYASQNYTVKLNNCLLLVTKKIDSKRIK